VSIGELQVVLARRLQRQRIDGVAGRRREAHLALHDAEVAAAAERVRSPVPAAGAVDVEQRGWRRNSAFEAVADFWTDPTHTQPLMAALMAGEFAVHTTHGDVYSVEEGKGWLAETGWRFTAHQPLAGPFSLVIADAA
jgi:hypothetical protein